MYKKSKNNVNKKIALALLSSTFIIGGLSTQNNAGALKSLFTTSSNTKLRKQAYKNIFKTSQEISLLPYKSLIDKDTGRMEIVVDGKKTSINPISYFIQMKRPNKDFVESFKTFLDTNEELLKNSFKDRDTKNTPIIFARNNLKLPENRKKIIEIILERYSIKDITSLNLSEFREKVPDMNALVSNRVGQLVDETKKIEKNDSLNILDFAISTNNEALLNKLKGKGIYPDENIFKRILEKFLSSFSAREKEQNNVQSNGLPGKNTAPLKLFFKFYDPSKKEIEWSKLKCSNELSSDQVIFCIGDSGLLKLALSKGCKPEYACIPMKKCWFKQNPEILKLALQHYSNDFTNYINMCTSILNHSDRSDKDYSKNYETVIAGIKQRGPEEKAKILSNLDFSITQFEKISNETDTPLSPDTIYKGLCEYLNNSYVSSDKKIEKIKFYVEEQLDISGCSGLVRECCKSGDLETLKFLVEEYDLQPDFKDLKYATSVSAKGKPSFELVKYLVEDCDVDINQKVGLYRKFLEKAKDKEWGDNAKNISEDIKIFRYLIKKGLELEGDTCLEELENIREKERSRFYASLHSIVWDNT